MIKRLHLKDKHLFFIGMFMIFIGMLMLNIFTPLVADDYNYSYSFQSGARIENLTQIAASMQAHYMTWGGRILPHTIAQIFLMLGTIWFDVCNAAAFVALGYLLYRFIYPNKSASVASLVIVYLGLFLVIPYFGQTVLWTVGACNYLWSMLFMVAFLLPFRLYIHKEYSMRLWKGIGVTILAFLAGGCNENTSAAILLVACSCMLYSKIQYKKCPLWMISSVIAGAVGFLFMLFAPGNSIRTAELLPDGTSLMTYKDRLVLASYMLETYAFYLVAAFVLLLIVVVSKRYAWQKYYMAITCFVAGILCNYAMVASPTYPDRAFFGSSILLLMSVLLLMDLIEKEVSLIWKQAIAVFLCIIVFFQGIYAFDSVFTTYYWYLQRESDILTQVEAGSVDITTFTIVASHPYSVFYDLSDLEEDATNWANTSFAKYHDLDSVRSIEEKVK